MIRNYLLLSLLIMGGLLTAQQRAFSFISTANPPADLAGNELPLVSYGELLLDATAIRAQLVGVPMENAGGRSPFFIELPTPEGRQVSFRIEESPVMHPDLAARYPDLKSYRAISAYGSGRIAVSSYGVAAALMGRNGEYFINRTEQGVTTNHLIYYTKDVDLELGNFEMPALGCGWDAEIAEEEAILAGIDLTMEDTPLGQSRTVQSLLGLHVYDIALACTGEFANVHGGTVAGVMNAYNEAMTVLNGLLEREVGVRFMLIAQNDSLIWTDPSTDPFTSANNGGDLLPQVGNAISFAGIGFNEFDLGHLLTGSCTDVGGVVSGQACTNGKTRGVTCNFSNNIAAVARGTMAHEIAHQFGVGHTWSNCPGSEGQLASGSAFEPGSGTTIMSYAGACGDQNIGGRSAYYHVGSIDQFTNFSRNINPGGCVTVLEPINNEPEIVWPYEDGFFIPISTPFELEASATDADDDNLIYNWEQYDLGPSSSLGNPFADSPLFRSYPPEADGFARVFPRIDRVISGNNIDSEQLPDYSRNLTFRMTVRDQNENAGASVWETVRFRAAEEAGPFLVTSPNTGSEVWQGGDYREITWDVANTNLAPVNCSSVDIYLSEDGGFTYPILLAERAPNNGSTFITVPAGLSGDEFRIKIKGSDNVFFDISNQDFVINPPTEANFTLSASPLSEQVCLPETAVLSYTAGSVLGFDSPITLALTSDLPAGATAEFNRTTIVPGESAELTIDLNEYNTTDLVYITIEASADGVATATRTVLLDVVANDFTDLSLVSPLEGEQGIQFAADYQWTASANADSYNVQVATSPSFSSETLFDEGINLTATNFAQADFFNPNTLYFWRVQPINECGPGPWVDPASFRTVSTQCETYTASDTPVLLPGSGNMPIRTSVIFVSEEGIISDLNIPNVVINYNVIRNMELTLISPAGTRVLLYDENCFFTNIINLGFDDDAPSNIACPPDDQRVFRPVGSLADFIGEGTFGNWTFEVKVTETGGSAGDLASWSIEFCAGVTNTPPSLIVNDDSEVPPGSGTNITGQVLRVEDGVFGPNEITYTLVRAPLQGFLRLGGVEINAGATMTQEQISAAQLFYQHTGSEEGIDDWSFVVTNPEGGYIPVTYHTINIFEGAVSDVNENLANEIELKVYPNPVSDQLQLRWNRSLGEDMPVELIDISGRRLLNGTVSGVLTNYQVDMQALPAGVYFLRMGGITRRVVKR